MTFDVYQARITVLEATPDYEWVPSRFGTMTSTFFAPMPDERRAVRPGCLRVVEGGSEPVATIVGPAGSFVELRGDVLFLFAPNRDGKTWKVYDAWNALVLARRGEAGFSLAGSPGPAGPVVARPPLAPAIPEGPRTSAQLCLFGD